MGPSAIPLDAHIPSRQRAGEAGVDIRPDAVPPRLAGAEHGPPSKPRRHQEAVLPRPALTPFAVGGIARGGRATGVAQAHPAAGDLAHPPLHGLIGHLGRGTVPPHHAALLVHQQAAWAPNHPAVVGHALAPARRRAAACADGVHARKPLRVDAAAHGRRGQADWGPGLMGLEKAAAPGALGAAGQPGPRGARQPALDRPVPHACEGRQPPQGDPLTGPEVRRGGLREVVYRLIDVVEQSDAHLPGGPAARLGGQGGHAEQCGRGVGLGQAQNCVLLVCKVRCIFMVCNRLTPPVSRFPNRAARFWCFAR
jgi:hypothetical protein